MLNTKAVQAELNLQRLKINRQVWCPVNYHVGWNCLSLNFSCGKDGLGLGIECLALSCLSVNRAEAFDTQLISCTDHGNVPSGDIFERLLASRILCLAHHTPTLVLHEIRTHLPRGSLLLAALRTTAFANLPRAILLTAFFFITRAMAFIGVDFFMAFMAAAFITDFFIGRAMLKDWTRKSTNLAYGTMWAWTALIEPNNQLHTYIPSTITYP